MNGVLQSNMDFFAEVWQSSPEQAIAMVAIPMVVTGVVAVGCMIHYRRNHDEVRLAAGLSVGSALLLLFVAIVWWDHLTTPWRVLAIVAAIPVMAYARRELEDREDEYDPEQDVLDARHYNPKRYVKPKEQEAPA